MSQEVLRPGHVAVVTGAGSGIGAALAAAFGAQGGRVVLADVDADGLARTDAALRADGVETLVVPTDVSDLNAVSKLARATLDRFARVDVLCNNAGVSTFNFLADQTLDDWRWVIGVNLWGVVYGVQTFVPILRAQGTPAHIVNTASVAGLWSGIPFIGPYAVSKVGVVSLSETLRDELRIEGSAIGVSVLCPGSVVDRRDAVRAASAGGAGRRGPHTGRRAHAHGDPRRPHGSRRQAARGGGRHGARRDPARPLLDRHARVDGADPRGALLGDPLRHPEGLAPTREGR
jgi:NAD(P)-dependent dehydrogenase (short-subunit alcohol dehydrogenase family)